MFRTDGGEVASVDRGDMGNVEAFGRSDHRRVRGSEGPVTIACDKLGNSEPVLRVYRLHFEQSFGKVA